MKEMYVEPYDESDEYLVVPRFFADIQPSRKSRVETYLADMDIMDQEAASSMAKDIARSDKPLAATVALIPVASHQEAHNITRTVGLYAQQHTSEPFSVVLLPNAPLDASRAASGETMDKLRHAAKEYPALDLRWYQPIEHEEAPIGDIRRKLWNAAVLLAYTEGSFDDNEAPEMLGLNHDIDTVSMTPRYIARVQQYRDRYKKRLHTHGIERDDMPVVATQVSHARDTQFEHASQAAFWFDFAMRQVEPGGVYEASLVIPFAHYARYGGFNADDRSYETKAINPNGVRRKIPGTIMGTSPRRFVERLQTNSLDEIWADGTFGATDMCRNPRVLRDITTERKEEVIVESLDEREMPYIFYEAFAKASRSSWPFQETQSQEELKESLVVDLTARKKLATEVLRRFVHAPMAAAIVESVYDTRQMAECYYSE